MKKIVLLSLLLLSLNWANAQSISLLGYGGALTGSRAYQLANDVRVKGDWSYGAGLEFGLPFGSITVAWSGQQTVVESKGFVSSATKQIDVNVNYIQLGFNKDFTDGKVRPHSIFSMGTAQYHPTGNNAYSDQWYFAATFGLGLKADINDRVGLRIQAKGNMPVQMGGAGIFCSFGSGCAPNIYFNPIVFQGEFTAGLAIKLK
ncbi:MAG: hypothetical protein CFE21_09995 [Bacteroidetes bacterium B1(2017)]|nr:MAG: hypothetical protein CFE21_09995 [Bacteroidetes bacterium B1(2017)]